MMIKNQESYLKHTVLFSAFFIIIAATVDVPTKFGLITVTHARAGDNSQFMTYLKRYATMDCPVINQISIIWNNQKSMQEMNIFEDKDKWKIPIYFLRTPNNAMDWRYLIPKQTISEVFFSIDDDINVGCQELMHGFDVWRQHAIGNIGPIVTYGARFYEFTLRSGFQYGRMKQKEYFNLGLINLCFLSRHFLQLYYAQVQELKQMRNHIIKKNNCDDIAMNWLVQYFYPELQTIVISGNIQNKSPAVAQSTSPTHYPYRSECINDWTRIFGVNPLRYTPIIDQHSLKNKRLSPLKEQIVIAKQKYLSDHVIKRIAVNQKTIDDILKSAPTEPSKQPNPIKSGEISSEFKKIELQNKELKASIEKLNNRLNSVPKTNTEIQLMTLSAKIEQEIQLNKELNYRLYWRSYAELFLILLVIFLVWRMFEMKEKNKKGKNFKLESSQIEAEIEQLK